MTNNNSSITKINVFEKGVAYNSQRNTVQHAKVKKL